MSAPSSPAPLSSPPASLASSATPAFAAATGGVGATLPYVEVQAENSATNGTIIGPSADYGTLPDEASYRKAVTLPGTGKFVEFTTPAPTNSIDFRYSIPDTVRRLGLHRAAVALHQRHQADRLHPDQRVQLVLRRLPVQQLAGQQPAPLLRRGAPALRRRRTRPGTTFTAAGRLRGHGLVVHDRLRRLRERRRRRSRSRPARSR